MKMIKVHTLILEIPLLVLRMNDNDNGMAPHDEY